MAEIEFEAKKIPKGVKSPDEIKSATEQKIQERKNAFMKKTVVNEIQVKKSKTPKKQNNKKIVPFGTTQRPQPPNKFREQGSLVVAKILAPQLGTDPRMRAQLLNDELKMGVFDYPILFAGLHFLNRAEVDGVEYYGYFFRGLFRGTQGIGGRARKDVLQLASNISGSSAQTIAKKPNIIARNTWNKNWRKKAENKGEIVDE
jgi:hypothetical protein